MSAALCCAVAALPGRWHLDCDRGEGLATITSCRPGGGLAERLVWLDPAAGLVDAVGVDELGRVRLSDGRRV